MFNIRQGELIPVECFTTRDKDVMAVAFSIAGAMKAAIDTPILTKEGNIDEASYDKYDKITFALTAGENKMSEIQQAEQAEKWEAWKQSQSLQDTARNKVAGIVALIIAGIVGIDIYFRGTYYNIPPAIILVTIFSLVSMLFINHVTFSPRLKAIRNIHYVLLSIIGAYIFYVRAADVTQVNYYFLKAVSVGAVSFFAGLMMIFNTEKSVSEISRNILITAYVVLGFLFSFAAASLGFAFLSWLGLNMAALIISEIIFLFFVYRVFAILWDTLRVMGISIEAAVKSM
ncbi:MAG: hypothetical protein IJT21_08315 [Synergistaceae bacterium]|nr:hypothetical protein [Synergistaceae bacterium]